MSPAAGSPLCVFVLLVFLFPSFLLRFGFVVVVLVVVGDRGIRWQLAWLLQSDYPLFRTTECSAAFLSMVVAILCFLVVCSFSSSHVFYVLFIC